LTLVMPAPGVASVWQASAWRDEGSWNQAVLEFPLDDTPIGIQLGEALICECALVDQSAAAPIAAMAAAIRMRR
jgi:hypothetical protein